MENKKEKGKMKNKRGMVKGRTGKERLIGEQERER